MATEEDWSKITFGKSEIVTPQDLLEALVHRAGTSLEYRDEGYEVVNRAYKGPHDTLIDVRRLTTSSAIAEGVIKQGFVYVSTCGCGQDMPLNKRKYKITKVGREELERHKAAAQG